ncbi:histidinol-phosphate transaminase [Plantibacter sp. T3]|uniref:histidinol-phosphate transaminase n=1 Tax=Plantibacter sp. T3 TaxID=2653161 RepID=UPI0012EFE3AD|nr:histidinol-phosphate transaminase [Plantibacter sp. T3]VXB23690.1 Putative phenylalanine aminotransferase [Plantibacter sp. T3]
MSDNLPTTAQPAAQPGRSPVRLRPEIADLPPYRQGKPAAPDAFKLSSNEVPFPPLDAVLSAITDTAAHSHRYPDGAALALRTALAETNGVTPERIHIGAGSVALLSQFITATAGPGDEVVFAWRSFEAYPGLVTVAGATSVRVPNRPDGSHDLEAMAAAVTDRTRVVIVCTPNNPTGPVVERAAFLAFLRSVPSDVLVLLDEAYREFVTDDDAVNGIPLLDEHPNLVVLRTFSKAYGLAGLRVGWAIGHELVLNGARNAAIPLSSTAPAQQAAIAGLANAEDIRARVAVITARRDDLAAALREQGWFIPAAQGNFVWFGLGEQTAAANETFLAHGIVGRAFPGDGVRISIGEAESIEPLLAAAAEILAGLPADHPTREGVRSR